MTDLLSALREFRVLEERRATASLAEAELARWNELRTMLGPRAALVAPPPEAKAAVGSSAVPPAPEDAAPLIDAGELEEVAVPAPIPFDPPNPASQRPPIASRFPSLLALESEATDPHTFAEPREPAHWEKTQPGFSVADFPEAGGARAPVEPAREVTAQVNLSELVPPPAPAPPQAPAAQAPPQDAPAPGQPIFAALLAEAGAGSPASPSASVLPAATPPAAIGTSIPIGISSPPVVVAPSISIPTERIKLPFLPSEARSEPRSEPEGAPSLQILVPKPPSDPVSPQPAQPPVAAMPPADEPLRLEAPPAPAPVPQQWRERPTVEIPALRLEAPPASTPLPLEESAPVSPPPAPLPLTVSPTPLPLHQQLDALAWGTMPSLVPSFDPVATPPPPTPIALGSPAAPPIALGGTPVAPEPVAAPIVPAAPESPEAALPIALGSPLAPAVESRKASREPERASDPVSLPVPDEPLAPAPLQLVPAPEPPPPSASLPEWLTSEPLAMVTAPSAPPAPVPVQAPASAPVQQLPEQPTVVLGPAADPRPERELPFSAEGPTDPGSDALRHRAFPKVPPPRWDPEVTDDEADLPMVIPEEELPPAPPPVRAASAPPPALARPTSVPPPPPAAPPVAPPNDRSALFGDYLRPPSVIPGEHRVVVHTLAGPLKRGTLREPDMESLEINLLPQGGGAVEKIAVGLVKAVFFMLAPGQEPPKPEGKRITVNFEDGRQLFGYCPKMRDSDPGFFLLPADSRANTARIYVFRAAVKSVIEAKGEG